MLLFCLTCVAVMMTLVSPTIKSDDTSSTIMIWGLFAFTVIMAFVAMKKIVSRFVLSASTTEIIESRSVRAEREGYNVLDDDGGGMPGNSNEDENAPRNGSDEELAAQEQV